MRKIIKEKIVACVAVLTIGIIMTGCTTFHSAHGGGGKKYTKQINTNPSKAKVYVDNKLIGISPVTLSFTSPSYQHTWTYDELNGRRFNEQYPGKLSHDNFLSKSRILKVEKDGYLPLQGSFTVSDIDNILDMIVLKRNPPPKVPTATANVRDMSRVTHGASPEFWPRVDPEGKRLLFYTRDLTKEDFSAYSIAMVNLSGAGRTLVAGSYAWNGTWFPDGKSFTYCYMKSEKSLLVKSSLSGAGMTFVSPSALGNGDGQPDVSPDGKKIAFHTSLSADASAYHICSVNSDGSEFTVYTEGTSPRWNPTGDMLAFDKTVGDTSHLFLLNLKNGQVSQLTFGDQKNTFPVWSPDGEWLAFISDRDETDHLYIMRKDGALVTQLTQGGAQIGFPDWGADGYIYFCTDAGATESSSENPFQWIYSDIWRLKPELPK